MTERDDHEAILSLLAKGYSIAKAAHVLGLEEADVRAALPTAADNFRNGEHLRQIWALEDWRLGKMLAKLFEDAMSAQGAATHGTQAPPIRESALAVPSSAGPMPRSHRR